MKINNVTEISAEDFKQEDRNTVIKLANILNPFMQQVVEINDKRIDYENRVENYIEIDMIVDANGVPTQVNKIRTDKTRSRGFTVIAVYNTTNSGVYPTSQPFIVFSQLSGGFVEVLKITGLPANQKYRLNIIVH